MKSELTGRKVFLIAAGAFGIIIGVNIVMAVQAVRTFPGLEVANSYVASQTFDAERTAQEALGWTLDQHYDKGELVLSFRDRDGLPVKLRSIEGTIGRPTEAREDIAAAFECRAGGALARQVDGPADRPCP